MCQFPWLVDGDITLPFCIGCINRMNGTKGKYGLFRCFLKFVFPLNILVKIWDIKGVVSVKLKEVTVYYHSLFLLVYNTFQNYKIKNGSCKVK